VEHCPTSTERGVSRKVHSFPLGCSYLDNKFWPCLAHPKTLIMQSMRFAGHVGKQTFPQPFRVLHRCTAAKKSILPLT
jgi:hypothetical protein